MYSTVLSLAVLAAAAAQGVMADFNMATPKLVQCGDAKLTWDSTKGPYNMLVVPAADPCSDVLVDLGDHAGTSMTWKKVALVAGQKVMLSLEDANGDEAWSGVVTVDKSDDTSCLSASVLKEAGLVASSAPAPAPVSSAKPASSAKPSPSSPAPSSTPAPTGGVANAGAGPDADPATSIVAAGAAGGGILGGSKNGAATVGVSSLALGAVAAVAFLAL